MTLPSERLRAAHLGWRKSEPASRSRVQALDSFGLQYERVDDFNVIVEGGYQLNLAMSFWRSNDGRIQGYLVSALDAEIKKNHFPKPVTDGRDSPEGSTPTPIPKPSTAESSVAGPTLDALLDGIASLLPVVRP